MLSIRLMFALSSMHDVDGLRVSYNISLLIAKSGKPHTIGQQHNVLHKPAHDIIEKIPLSIKKIPLSINTVQRRIDEVGRNVENILCNFLQTNIFSLQLDESTLSGNEATYLETDTRGESIFQNVERFFTDKAIPWKNIVSVSIDGAPSMVSFIAHLKRQLLEVLVLDYTSLYNML
ncbi:unnamed protein product [Psylliodes chrysocephalus]|uniref:DUF4371 domain-containing protein n=1 Tax=Psylliodes chrysocephalus TaxID=3402493 RepID=A0A9P0CEB6_9CUCU|nr:unnamed protein product [Psylliodes chrysocephala]